MSEIAMKTFEQWFDEAWRTTDLSKGVGTTFEVKQNCHRAWNACAAEYEKLHQENNELFDALKEYAQTIEKENEALRLALEQICELQTKNHPRPERTVIWKIANAALQTK